MKIYHILLQLNNNNIKQTIIYLFMAINSNNIIIVMDKILR